jgi:hypothetical protein
MHALDEYARYSELLAFVDSEAYQLLDHGYLMVHWVPVTEGTMAALC